MTGSLRARPDPTPLILSVALFMEGMDGAVIATSLPAIAADVGATPVALKLAFTAYFLAMAIFIPISALLADRFGPRRVFQWALVVFMLGSLGCAMASSLEAFVAARFLGGMGGALMAPIARLILIRLTPRADLMRASAAMTIPAMAAPLIGPLVGGALTTYAHWRLIFLIAPFIGLIGIFMISRFLRDAPGEAPRRADLRGFALLALTFSGFLTSFSLASLPFSRAWAAVALLTGAAAGLGYLRHARRAAEPLIDLDLFRNSAFWRVSLATSIFHVGVGAIPFLLPLMLQLGFGLTAFESGLITFVGGAGALLAKFLAPRVFASFDFRKTLILAVICSAIGITTKGFFSPEAPLMAMLAVLAAGGVLKSLFFTGQHVLSISTLEPREMGPALVVAIVLRPISIALGVATAGFVLEWASRDGVLTLGAFQTAFFCLGAISFLAAAPLIGVDARAGQELAKGAG